jgi:hypothetical protein
MSSFEDRIAAFQMALDLFTPYSADIERFGKDVLVRLGKGEALTHAQATRLLTRDAATIKVTLAAFSKSVVVSKPRLETLLSQARIAEAVQFVRDWPDSMWRVYEGVLDDFAMPENPALKSPHDVSRPAVTAIKRVFPIYLDDGPPLRDADLHFADQLRTKGNPWLR